MFRCIRRWLKLKCKMPIFLFLLLWLLQFKMRRIPTVQLTHLKRRRQRFSILTLNRQMLVFSIFPIDWPQFQYSIFQTFWKGMILFSLRQEWSWFVFRHCRYYPGQGRDIVHVSPRCWVLVFSFSDRDTAASLDSFIHKY